MAAQSFELTADQRAMQLVAKSLAAEADGKQLRKDLIAGLREAVAPGVSAVQSKLRAIPNQGITSSPGLGAYLAPRVKTQVRLAGRSTGVRVRIAKTDKLRGFTYAARRLNRRTWKHKVFGRDVWVEQRSPITGYFDETLSAERAAYRKAVRDALERMARRVADRVT